MNFRRPFLAVTPTLDGDVLEVLSRAQAEYTGRRVHQLTGHGSERGVRNALARLVDQGVVLSRTAGSAKLYSLNREHLAAPWIEGLAGMRSQLLRRLSEKVGGWEPEPVLGVVFGSVARGEAAEGSDLDLLVIRPGDHPADSEGWEAQVAELQRAATAWTGNDARVLEFSERELADALSADEPVLRRAAREGLVFVGSARQAKQMLAAGAGEAR
jgi:hypothetical protein